jgi:hypothetical protein
LAWNFEVRFLPGRRQFRSALFFSLAVACAPILPYALAQEKPGASHGISPGLSTGVSPYFDNPKYESLTVSTVGGRKITAQEFLLNYAFGPAFPKRGADARHKYLNYMIYEKLLALKGYAEGVDASRDARLSLREIEGDLATEELYKDDVLNRVKVTEPEILQGMGESRSTLRVRWLYRNDEGDIRSDAARLGAAGGFDSLFSEECRGRVHAEDRSMEVTHFKMRMQNAAFASVLDTMKPGTCSAPVHGPDGWYIVKLDEAWREPIMSQSDEEKARNDVERYLLQHDADSLSDLYVRSLMETKNPTIVRKSLDLLHADLARQILPPEVYASWNLDKRLADRWGVPPGSGIDSTLDLVTFRNGALRIRDFLDWYHARELNLKLDLTSPEKMYASLEPLVWRMTRDRLLVQKALARGYGDRPLVRRQAAWWKDKIVYNIVKARMADSIKIDEARVRAYYDAHPRDFRDTTGAAIPFAKAEEDAKKAYYAEELTKKTLHEVLRLKQHYHVDVREDVLKSLPVDAGSDPRAIDVYLAKTGGVFPRPAFPTIDYEWQAWQ